MIELKVEFDLKERLLLSFLVIAGICFVSGFLVGQSFKPESQPANYLTTADLNRSDIDASIVLSRFCEGMGLRSSVIWQQDSQGNTYGLPICLKANG